MDILMQLTEHRRNLHMIPELDRNLPKTTSYIKEILEKLDCSIIESGGGICAYFDRGKTTTVAFRSDMDALPITEMNSHSFVSSNNGIMHACGHDGHMAMLLSLAQYVHNTTELRCNVMCIFQPAEETTGGAKDICESGIFKKYNITEIYGIHLWPYLEAGKLGSRPGPMMARCAEVNIEVSGVSSHATDPEKGKDALVAACDFIRMVYDDKKHLDAEDNSINASTIICFGKMNSGTVRNAISDSSIIQGTMRALTDERFSKLESIIDNAASYLSESTGCTLKAMRSEGYPPIINDAELYSSAISRLGDIDYTELEKPAMISDDFSFYGYCAPSLFFFLGTGTGKPLHSNDFDFDEKILVNGFELYRHLLLP